MIKLLSRRESLLALGLLFAGGRAAAAEDDDHDDDDNDYEEALRALQQGQVKPLSDIIEKVQKQLGGDVIGVEFERDGGRYVYEIKIVGPDGRLREVYVDAMTAVILSDEHD
jgi:uncharacterized membrane protein YkoI